MRNKNSNERSSFRFADTCAKDVAIYILFIDGTLYRKIKCQNDTARFQVHLKKNSESVQEIIFLILFLIDLDLY